MLRSYTPADALTIGNASCGTLAIFLSLDYMAFGDHRRLWAAILLLPAALILDVMDGYVAPEPFPAVAAWGRPDSLADVIRSASRLLSSVLRSAGGGWDMLVLTYFVVCASAVWPGSTSHRHS